MANAEPPASVLDGRYRQTFPVLAPAQVETVQRFAGPPRRCTPGELMYGLGERNVSSFLVLSGCL